MNDNNLLYLDLDKPVSYDTAVRLLKTATAPIKQDVDYYEDNRKRAEHWEDLSKKTKEKNE